MRQFNTDVVCEKWLKKENGKDIVSGLSSIFLALQLNVSIKIPLTLWDKETISINGSTVDNITSSLPSDLSQSNSILMVYSIPCKIGQDKGIFYTIYNFWSFSLSLPMHEKVY